MSKNATRRKDTGRPGNGGKYDFSAGERSAASLDQSLTTYVPNAEAIDRWFGGSKRAAEYLETGYAPVASEPSVAITGDADHLRDEWWAQALTNGELRADGSGVLKMPDDYTPNMTGGRSLAGNRRTHRMRYVDDGFAVRIPSVTSIKAFAKENPGETFDVPFVAADAKDMNRHTAVARITPGVDGSWTVEVQGIGGASRARLGELIASRLESRAPSRGPKETGSLLERYKERRAREGAALRQAAPSAFIDSFGYNAADSMLTVRMKAGKAYGYQIPPQIAEKVMTHSSPGEAYNEYVKWLGRNPETGKRIARGHIEVTECSKCHNWHAADKRHTCRAKANTPDFATPKAYNSLQEKGARRLFGRVFGRNDEGQGTAQ